MHENPTGPTPRPVSLRTEFPILLLFLAVTVAVYYRFSPGYFLYEDDIFHVGVPATHSFSWLWEQIGFVWKAWPQGRPGMFTVVALEGGLIHMTGSVLVAFIPGMLTIAANGYLLYRLLALKVPAGAALAGALISLGSCADPHKVLPTHTPLQIAIMLNLLGLILYQKDRPVLAYLVAGSSLLFYEITFALFASAEVFRQLDGRFSLRRIGGALFAWLGVAVAVLLIRVGLGESRAVEATANWGELCQRIWQNIDNGPRYGLYNSYQHPLVHLQSYLAEHRLMLYALAVSVLGGVTGLGLVRRKEGGWAPLNLWLTGVVLAIFTFGPYALQLKRTVYPGFARPVSGYHLCLGLAFGLAAAVLVGWCRHRPWLRRTAYVALLLPAGLSTYQNQLIAQDYVESARYQAHFWSEVRRLASDARPGDVILVPRKNISDSIYLESNSWGVTYTWFVLFPQTGPLSNWFTMADVRPVTVFVVAEDWIRQIVETTDRGLMLPTLEFTPPGFTLGEISMEDRHTIVLEPDGMNPYVRRFEPVLLGSGTRLELKPAPAEPPVSLKQTALADALFSTGRGAD